MKFQHFLKTFLVLPALFTIALAANDYSVCQECVHCEQYLNDNFVHCNKNSMNSAIVTACQIGLGCDSWELNTRDEDIAMIGGQVLTNNGSIFDVDDLNYKAINDWLLDIEDFEEEGILVVNWKPYQHSEAHEYVTSNIASNLSESDNFEKRDENGLKQMCNLIQSSRNGAFTWGATVRSEFCIALGQNLASEACSKLVSQFYAARSGRWKNGAEMISEFYLDVSALVLVSITWLFSRFSGRFCK